MSIGPDGGQQDPESAVVEGEAFELPSEPPVAGSPSGAPIRPVYEPEPYEARSYASAATAGGPAARGSGWPDPGIDLSERPEIVVGAAFGGGFLLALILRKLGN